MRRFIGILALGLSLWTQFPAGAEDLTVTYPLYFQTSKQSMWGAGTTGYSYNINLGSSWNKSGTSALHKESYKKVGIDLGLGTINLGTFGGEATVDTKGSIGLNFNAYATSGDVSVSYPMALKFTCPDPTTLLPGQSFPLTISYAPGGPALLSTQSPDAGVSLSAYMNITPLRVNIKAKVFGDYIVNNDFVNFSVAANQVLFDTHNLTAGSFDLADLPGLSRLLPKGADISGILTGSYKIPSVATSGSGDGVNRTVTSKGEDPFLAFDLHLTRLLSLLTGTQNYFSGSYDFGSRDGGVNFSYNWMDLYGEVPISLAQDFSFTPTPIVTLNISNGQTINVTLPASGTKTITLTMPTDGAGLTIRPIVSLNNAFRNRTHLKMGGYLMFDFGEISASLYARYDGVSVPGLPSLNFQPIAPVKLFGGDFLDKTLFDKTFSMGGFPNKSVSPFVISPHPAPLVARDDTYIAKRFPNGPGYYCALLLPGVLSNDLGVGVMAVEQDFYNATNKTRIKLWNTGALSWTITDTRPGSYRYPYQIRDNQGHTATAYITIVCP